MPECWPEKCIINLDAEQPNNSLRKGPARSTAHLNHLLLDSTTAFLFTVPQEGMRDVRHHAQQAEITFLKKVFCKDVTSLYTSNWIRVQFRFLSNLTTAHLSE